MQAKLLVRDNPYFCVTDERGIFCIPNLPENEELEFQFWHERVGYLRNIKSDAETFTTNEKGRLQTKLMQPVTDSGEFDSIPSCSRCRDENVGRCTRNLAVLVGFRLGTTAPAPQPEWGTILGRIVYDGKGKIPAPRMLPINKAPAPGMPAAIEEESLVVNKQNSGLANVFVFLRTKPSKIHPGYEHATAKDVTLCNKNFRFEPHALAIWNKDALDLQNEENFGVNVKYDSPTQGFNVLLSPPVLGNANNVKKQFPGGERKPGNLSDAIYPWKSGQLLCCDNPYFCVTDNRGIFCIPNLPTDEVLEFVFWHERCGYMAGIANQAPNPAHNIILNKQGRLMITLTEPVLDLGEFLADPKKLQ